MSDHVHIEVSQQDIPRAEEGTEVWAESHPLHELAKEAPWWEDDITEDIIYGFSNDESAAYYDQMQVRTGLPEYQQATNRTAILIGEGSLASALRYIPEDTIIMLDKSASMCNLVTAYIEGLRQCETRYEWFEFMGLWPKSSDELYQFLVDTLEHQVNEWLLSGYPAAFADDTDYALARELALKKAIIPWRGDISSHEDMATLGQALKRHDATVTLMNLTNALTGQDLPDASDYADRLAVLPMTPNAPILTTSFRKTPPWSPFRDHFTVEATGPFFGLDNFAKHGGATHRPNVGSALDRQYVCVESSYEPESPGLATLESVVRSVLGDNYTRVGNVLIAGCVRVRFVTGDNLVITDDRPTNELP